MPNEISQKLKIRDDYTLLIINAPSDFKKNLEPAPRGLKISTSTKNYQQLHWFVANKKQMDDELEKVLTLMKDDVVCWIYYPKGTSKMQTDLTRDKGWENLLKHDELQWINLISFNETWSAFGCRLKTEADKNKTSEPKVREIFKYINAEKKTIRLPEELAAALKKNKTAEAFFNSLSFSNRKEYVEWIVTAKREETRFERIKGTIERLNKKWKNPRNI